MQRRSLEEVLDHFIPEDEQREARERAGRSQAGAAAPARWLLAASPERPLSRALALDLAAALTRKGGEAVVVAPPPAPMGLPSSVRWSAVPPGDSERLREVLAAVPEHAHAIVLVHPGQVGLAAARLTPGLVRGALLPVDASAQGSTTALGWLRASAAGLAGLRLGAVVVGAPSRGQARDVFAKLASAARRQLELRVASFGEVERDANSFRSLLRDVPVAVLDSEAASSRSLDSLSRQLAEGAGAAAGFRA